jgi:hypothetical protein
MIKISTLFIQAYVFINISGLKKYFKRFEMYFKKLNKFNYKPNLLHPIHGFRVVQEIFELNHKQYCP